MYRHQELQNAPETRRDDEMTSDYQMDAVEREGGTGNDHTGKGFLRLDIKNFSKFCRSDTNKIESESISIRGLSWKAIASTRSVQNKKHLAFVLECNGDKKVDGNAWTCVTSVRYQIHQTKAAEESSIREHSLTFDSKRNAWGISWSLLNIYALTDPVNGVFKNDSVTLTVHFTVDTLHGVTCDSRKPSGFIGLQSQGKACSMNSILQTIFYTNILRKAVYQMEVPTTDDNHQSVVLAMQRLFYDLETSKEPVQTSELRKAIGWDSADLFLEQDGICTIQELLRVLLNNLNIEEKGVKVDIWTKLFRGKYMKCYIDINRKLRRERFFYDVQLNVKRSNDSKGSSKPFTILEAFQEYFEMKNLDGNEISSFRFPSILVVHLMRFHFDRTLQCNFKLNDRFGFGELLDLNQFSRNNNDCTYGLYAVHAHAGDDANYGHYSAYINTDVKGNTSRWCKFDDETVSDVTFIDAIVGNFGGNDSEESAYMLVYIRKDQLNDVFCDVSIDDIPPELLNRFATDVIEEKDNQLNLFIITDEIIRSHIGFGLFDFDVLERPEIHFSIDKTAHLEKLLNIIQTKLLKSNEGDDLQFRAWIFSENQVRDGKTLKCLSRVRASEQLCFTGANSGKKICEVLHNEKTIVYVERLQTLLPYFNEDRHLLIFLKYYNTEEQRIIFVGTIICDFEVPFTNYCQEILAKINMPLMTSLRFYEEVTPTKVRLLPDITRPLCSILTYSDERNGSIIIFERTDATTGTINTLTFIKQNFDHDENEDAKLWERISSREN